MGSECWNRCRDFVFCCFFVCVFRIHINCLPHKCKSMIHKLYHLSKYTIINCTVDWPFFWGKYDGTQLTTLHCVLKWPHLSCRDMLLPEIKKKDKLWILLIIDCKTSSDAQIYVFCVVFCWLVSHYIHAFKQHLKKRTSDLILVKLPNFKVK